MTMCRESTSLLVPSAPIEAAQRGDAPHLLAYRLPHNRQVYRFSPVSVLSHIVSARPRDLHRQQQHPRVRSCRSRWSAFLYDRPQSGQWQVYVRRGAVAHVEVDAEDMVPGR